MMAIRKSLRLIKTGSSILSELLLVHVAIRALLLKEIILGEHAKEISFGGFVIRK